MDDSERWNTKGWETMICQSCGGRHDFFDGMLFGVPMERTSNVKYIPDGCLAVMGNEEI